MEADEIRSGRTRQILIYRSIDSVSQTSGSFSSGGAFLAKPQVVTTVEFPPSDVIGRGLIAARAHLPRQRPRLA